jgi:succinate dehydrogenase / fumarate reductase cytochrome b subunit
VVLIFSHETYDFLSNEILGANWWAIVGTLIIGLGVGVHILYAIVLTLQNMKARGKDRYASGNKTPIAWSSKNMFVLGVFIVLFLILHMYQMWYQMQFKELFGMEGVRHDGAQLVVEVLSQPWVLITYVVGFIALWFHLNHGFWSAFHSVGWNNDIWMKRLKRLGYFVSTLIVLGFIVVAIAVHFGYSNLLA